MDPALMARLQWRIEAEMLWHDHLPALAHATLDGIKGKARIDTEKARKAAQHLLTSMFPED